MGRKRQNKKKQNRKAVERGPPARKQEVVDELVALEAVFADDFSLHEDRLGFDLRVLPFPSKVEVNYVSATLGVRYGDAYPRQPPELTLSPEGRTAVKEVEELLEELNQLASDLSKTNDVFMFSIIDLCQETLLGWNAEIVAERKEQAAERSASIALGDWETEANFFSQLQIGSRHGLFRDDMPRSRLNQKVSTTPAYAVASDPVHEVQKKKRNQQERKEMQHGSPSTSATTTELTVKVETVQESESPTSTSSASSSEEDAPDLEKAQTIGVSRSMLSLVASMIDRVGPLPIYLGLSRCRGDDPDEATADVEMSKFKTEALLGHLLKLATASGTGSLTRESFPLLCGELRERGILPDWLHWMLTKRPTLFNKLFAKFFRTEIEGAQSSPLKKSTFHRELLNSFWTVHAPSDSSRPAKAPSHSRQVPLRVSELKPSTRYSTDFDEIRVFGKGGFGVVVAAVNRLDGRQYAVKKIKLTSTFPSIYNKIIREVATLARLQHPNVVRYFQAWLEPATEADALSSEDSMDLDMFAESDPEAEPGTFTRLLQHKRQPAPTGIPEDESDAERSYASGTSDAPQYQGPYVQRPSVSIHFDQDPTVETLQDFDQTCRRPQHQVLYIQMEACSRTLQEMLSSQKKLEEQERWEILRQILLGLSYIHAQRIVHRDLKPPNIFYLATGEVKLGDFGLAKIFTAAGEASIKEGSVTSETQIATPTRQTVASEASGVCGTSFYIAPEIQNRWPSYDSKVDMFSLGVVIFELWHPFSTGMERLVLLRDLRENGRLPKEWMAKNPTVAELVLQLTSNNPGHRPSAKDLLRSDYLPPRVGHEQLRDLIRSLEDDKGAYDRVVTGVFNSSQALTISEGPGFTVSDMAGAPCLQTGGQREMEEKIRSTVKDVFSMHGAIEMKSRDVGLFHRRMPLKAVKMMSSEGDLYALKHDLRCPFVEWVAEEIEKMESTNWGEHYDPSIPLDNLRRFDISYVSSEAPGHAVARQCLRADIDFVTASQPRITEAILKDKIQIRKLLSERLLAEAEIIKIINEVLQEMKFLEMSENVLEVRLTHAAICHASLKQIGAATELLCQALDQMFGREDFCPSPGNDVRSETWSPIQKALEDIGLNSSETRSCRRFFAKLSGPCRSVLTQLASALSNNGQNPLSPTLMLALEEITTLLSLLEAWNLREDHILLDPIMCPEADYYSGIYFKVYLMHPSKKSGTYLATGGRYDKLLTAALMRRRQSLSGAGGRYGLVGATLDMDQIIKKEREQHPFSKGVRPTSSDVLVCSKSGGTSSLESRMELIAQLWRQGIKAEMLHRVAPNMTAQYDYAVSSGIRILVTIDEKYSSSETVRVKNLDRKNEEEVSKTDLASYIENLIQSRTSHTCSKK